ncbi:MAG: o-succinylbenzoate synthase [Acidobacteria bacterium]|nr:o-succinylbenzoate synthase [Acidobacteriota bacterium]
MKIEKIELKEISMPLVSPFETSFGRTTLRRILLVKLFSDGLIGYGECTAPEHPFYNHESIDTAWLMISEYLAPSLIGKTFSHPKEVSRFFPQIRGHNMAKAALETAVWEFYAKAQNIALSKLLGGMLKEIPCGVSIGIQENIASLLKKIEKELLEGYRRIKIKIKPNHDIDLIKAVRKEFPKLQLMVDANSAYTLSDLQLLKSFDDYNLMMIEQPLEHDDMIDHSELQEKINTPICLDESILSVDDARRALSIEACKIINIKLGRVGGHLSARRIHDYSLARNIPVWCGGMLESGIGRAHNIALSSLIGFVLPGDVSASSRYWHQDIVEPEIKITSKGTIIVPTTPGLGFEVNEKRINELTQRSKRF